jgi:DNA-binding CsgD family transcriptional regulator
MRYAMQDHRKQRLTVADVQAMLRLVNELHADAVDGKDFKVRLLDGVRTLTMAEHASVSVATFNPRNPELPDTVSVMSASVPQAPATTMTTATAGARSRPRTAMVLGPDVARASPCPWRDYRRVRPARGASAAEVLDAKRGRLEFHWCTSAPTATTAVEGETPSGALTSTGSRRTAKRPRAGHAMYSFLPLADDRVVACLTVGRGPAQPRFSLRERSIVCTLHTQVAWVYGADVMLASPKARALAPRERETLRHLLAGKSEKQIAHEMRISHNTIHTYVKALHKHFRVSSRRELLARQSQWQVDGKV